MKPDWKDAPEWAKFLIAWKELWIWAEEMPSYPRSEKYPSDLDDAPTFHGQWAVTGRYIEERPL